MHVNRYCIFSYVYNDVTIMIYIFSNAFNVRF